MKQVYIEKQVKDQAHQNFGDATPGVYRLLIRVLPNSDFLNIFQTRNKAKGPPGPTRSPGHFPEHPPDGVTSPKASPLSSKREGSGVSQNIKTIQFLNHTYSNFYKHLIFTIMKKQILFLAFFVLAVFAVVNKSYGQDINYIGGAPDCAAVTILPCTTEDALHPLPGKNYTYNITATPTPTIAGGGYVQWFVYDATTTPAVITVGSMAAAAAAAEVNTGASKFLLLADAAKYNLTTSASQTIDISWQSFDGAANQILLVAYVKGEGGCSDNIQVFRIQPAFAFSLDIAGLMPTGKLPASGNAVECVTPVQTATYAKGPNELTMDYGDNYIFYTVTAANFVNSWKPAFSLPAAGNTTGTTLALTDVEWAYPTDAVKTTGGTWNAATAPVLAQAGSKAVGATGECIVVRVHVVHGKNENTASSQVTLGVDGVMFDPAKAVGSEYTNTLLTDLDPSAAGSACTNTATDQAIYDLTGRPAITTTITPSPGFVPKN